MGVRATWLVDAARLTGYPVSEVAGWRGRGHGDFRVLEGVVLHHTADGPTGIYPSLGVVHDGRAELAGPLANLGLGRDGTIFVIADGVGWHAGASTWAGFTDLNDEFLGIEAESTGTRDDWTPQQRDCYPRLVAALLFYIRRGADRACGHKECAVPGGRKIDPAFWDLSGMRRQVAYYLADPVARIPRLGSTAQEDDMQADERNALFEILKQLTGSPELGKFPGWETRRYLAPGGKQESLTLVDLVRSVDRELNSRLTLANRPGDEGDSLYGQVLSLRAELRRLATVGVAIDGDALADQVVHAAVEAGIAEQVVEALGARLSHPTS